MDVRSVTETIMTKQRSNTQTLTCPTSMQCITTVHGLVWVSARISVVIQWRNNARKLLQLAGYAALGSIWIIQYRNFGSIQCGEFRYQLCQYWLFKDIMPYRQFVISVTAYCSAILIQLHCFFSAPPTLLQKPFKHIHSCDRFISLNYYPAFQIAYNFCSSFNKEFRNFHSSPNIDSIIKSMRMMWVEHAAPTT